MISQKIRVYPTNSQKKKLEEYFGFARFSYNAMLERWKSEYEIYKKDNTHTIPSEYGVRDWFKENKPEWAKDYTNMIVETEAANLAKAYKSFFRKVSGFPKFHSKKNGKFSFSINKKNIGICRIVGNRIYLDKADHIKLSELQKYNNPKQFTFSKVLDRYYVSIIFDDTIQPYDKTGLECGIDLGVKTFATIYDSNNNSEKIDFPKKKYKEISTKINLLNRNMSKKDKKSKRYVKALKKLHSLYFRRDNITNDFLNKTANYVLKKYDHVGLEDLSVSEMEENHKMAKNMAKMNLKTFAIKIASKAKNCGKEVVTIDRYYPSSQLCSVCGYQNPRVKNLNIRQWTCPVCHTHHDRDVNAAINILRESQNSQKE
jgi:putative transposase